MSTKRVMVIALALSAAGCSSLLGDFDLASREDAASGDASEDVALAEGVGGSVGVGSSDGGGSGEAMDAATASEGSQAPAESAAPDRPDSAAPAPDGPLPARDAEAAETAPPPVEAGPPPLCCVNATQPSQSGATCPGGSPACGSPGVYCDARGRGWNCWTYPVGTNGADPSTCTTVNCCSAFVGTCP